MSLKDLSGAVAVAAALASTACVDAVLASRENVNETRPLEPGGRFTLENVNGRVSVQTWAEAQVRIEAEKAASSASMLDAIKVEIEGEGSHVDVRTRYPRGSFMFGGGKVDYRITVPVGANVKVGSVNGRIEIQGVGGEVRATTTNGSVSIEDAAGDVEASTVNGSINAGYRTWSGNGHRFSTTNGSITLTAPDGIGGRLDAQTVNGSITNDLTLQSTEKASRRRLIGRFGSGQGSLDLSTVNGSIRIRRR